MKISARWAFHSSFPGLLLAVSASLQAGPTLRDCADCPELVVIPPGSYIMGAPADEPGFSVIEGPQRRVNIHAFAAGKFDVTRGEWAAFASATKRVTPPGCSWSPSYKGEPDASWQHLGFAQNDAHPVVCVTWKDTQDYVRWLARRTGHTYRLLTEAEWEYAARAGTTTAYPWGSAASHEYANYGLDKGFGTGRASGRDQWVFTSPVGSFPPNAFGLTDMHGNVLQWVQDCFAPSYDGLPADGSAFETVIQLKLIGDLADMTGKSSCAYRMLRGGDWADPPAEIRSAFRNFGLASGERSGGIGFRVARNSN